MKGNKIFTIVIVVLMLLLILSQIFGPKTISWNETYLKDKKNPYDLYALYEMLPDLFKNKKISYLRIPPYNAILESDTLLTNHPVNYLFIGSFASDSLSKKALSNFVLRGNNVFISGTYDLPDYLLEECGLQMHSYYYDLDTLQYSDTIKVYAASDVERKNPFRMPVGDCANFLDLQEGSAAEVLMTDSLGYALFVRYRHGSGYYYLSVIPKIFSNYYVMKDLKNNLALQTLAYLPQYDIWYDEYAKLGREGGQSPLRVIFFNPTLQWSYYIIIVLLLLYMLFYSKRLQRVIPVLTPPANTSIAFSKTISMLYLRKRDHRSIAIKKAEQFLEMLRERYRINTTEFNKETLAELSGKSGVPLAMINDINSQINLVRHNESIDGTTLLELNTLITKFEKIANTNN
ncbi:MAG: hypothetical protein IPO27_01525 [Bacteroidetes bacterium]|nr:hypothetical protein [Bacteroidota bacterium]